LLLLKRLARFIETSCGCCALVAEGFRLRIHHAEQGETRKESGILQEAG